MELYYLIQIIKKYFSQYEKFDIYEFVKMILNDE